MWNILCYPWWYVYTTYTDIEHNKSLPENRHPFGPILAGVQYTRCHQRLTWLPTSLLCVSYYICEYWNPSTICSRYKCYSLNWMHCFIEKWRNICISWHIYYITESHIIVFIKGYQFSSGLLSEYFLPEASFSLRVLWLPVSVCVHVCVCVNYELEVYRHDNQSPVQARITKFGPDVQNALVKISIVFCREAIDLDPQGQIWL